MYDEFLWGTVGSLGKTLNSIVDFYRGFQFVSYRLVMKLNWNWLGISNDQLWKGSLFCQCFFCIEKYVWEKLLHSNDGGIEIFMLREFSIFLEPPPPSEKTSEILNSFPLLSSKFHRREEQQWERIKIWLVNNIYLIDLVSRICYL